MIAVLMSFLHQYPLDRSFFWSSLLEVSRFLQASRCSELEVTSYDALQDQMTVKAVNKP